MGCFYSKIYIDKIMKLQEKIMRYIYLNKSLRIKIKKSNNLNMNFILQIFLHEQQLLII